MRLEGIDGVGAAGRGEPARRGTPLGRTLVPLDHADQPRSRASNWSRSNCSSIDDRSPMPGRPPNRYSPGGRRPSDEAACNMALRRRRTVLRVTAGPRARPMANATRGGVEEPGGSRRHVHHSTPARARRPSAARREKARRSRRRQIKPTDGDGPWRGVPSARRVRPGCSCGSGSRASWPGDGCSVGRCASRSSPVWTRPVRTPGAGGNGETQCGGLAPRGSVSPGRANTTGERSSPATMVLVGRPVSSACGHLLACGSLRTTLSTRVDKHVDVLGVEERRCR